jgi:hypothetical protein
VSGGDPTITHCTIDGNVATQGGGVFISGGGQSLIANTILSGNHAYAIFEGDAGSDPLTSHNLFIGNSTGDYFDENASALSGVAAINALAEAGGNVSGDPLFFMDGAEAITGDWTAAPTVSAAAGTTRTVLTDATASYAPGALAGELIRVDAGEKFCALITSNTATMIEVMGDVTALAQTGGTYRIVDYHIELFSAARSRGDASLAPATDFEGDARPGPDNRVDIGIDEVPTVPTGTQFWTRYD